MIDLEKKSGDNRLEEEKQRIFGSEKKMKLGGDLDLPGLPVFHVRTFSVWGLPWWSSA